MNAQKCSGCPNILKGISLLCCCRCSDKYHYTCVNFNKKDYESFDKDFKDTWVCPSCRCREPKLGDNTNTPIRTPDSVASRQQVQHEYDNVTLRCKTRSSVNCSCLSPDLIREIIREELDRKFATNIEDIRTQLVKFEEALALSNSERDIFKAESDIQKSLITQLQNENQELRTTTQDLSHRLLQVEQLSRANNIELQCVPEYKNENLYTTVQQLSNTIKCPVSESDLHYCSRIAKLNTSSPRPRSILVRFSSRRLRDTFLAGVIKYNKSNPGDKLNSSHLGLGGKKTAVFVSEHLTPETKALHAAARRKARELNYKFVWVRDGKVFLRKTETASFILVKDLSVLSSLA